MSSSGPSDCEPLHQHPVCDLSHPQAIAGLWAIVIVFLAVRLPLIYLQPGGEDEDCYAVPGWSLLNFGTLNLPHVPARNPESVYFRSDEALFAEPPLSFVLQAVAFGLLPDVYGTARLVSLLAGAVLLGLLYFSGRTWGCSRGSLLTTLAMLSLSRWFFFPAMRARPDMLCALFGVAVVCLMRCWQQTRQRRFLLGAGVMIGLGGLTHPFAIVFAVQAAVWLVWNERGWKRVNSPLWLAAVSLFIAAAWLPLILANPDVFAMQFRNQYLHGGESSLWQRLLSPLPAMLYHGAAVWNYIGPWQVLLPASAAAICLMAQFYRRPSLAAGPACLGLSGLFLIVVLVGTHHRTFGYFVYPVAMQFLCLAHVLTWLQRQFHSTFLLHTFVRAGVTIALVCTMLPGAGLRALVVHLQRRGDINYNAPAFARHVIEQLSRDAVYAVDTQFTLDFLVSGRKVYYAQTLPQYFRLEQFDFDYLVVSRYGLETGIADSFPGPRILTAGSKQDPFACYVEVYASRHRAQP